MATSGDFYCREHPSAPYRAELHFSWTLSGGTISWKVYCGGRSSSPTRLATSFTLRIVSSSGTSIHNQHYQFYSSPYPNYSTGQQLASGTFAAVPSFTVYLEKVYIHSYENSNSQTFTADAGNIWIYTGGSWHRAVPYIYTGGSWHRTVPYIYTGGSWHQCGG